jgi:hypothetical protein
LTRTWPWSIEARIVSVSRERRAAAAAARRGAGAIVRGRAADMDLRYCP